MFLEKIDFSVILSVPYNITNVRIIEENEFSPFCKKKKKMSNAYYLM